MSVVVITLVTGMPQICDRIAVMLDVLWQNLGNSDDTHRCLRVIAVGRLCFSVGDRSYLTEKNADWV
ncbi:hypothetical protein ABN584_24955 [Gloeocapsa sp. BRSZ]